MRLTKKIKEEIVAAVQRTVFQKKFETFVEREKAVGDALFEAQFANGGLALLEECPAEWFRPSDHLQLERLAGPKGSVYVDLDLPNDICDNLGLRQNRVRYYNWIGMSRERPMPQHLLHSEVKADDAVLKLSKRAAELRTASMNLREELEATLDACTTVAKLRQSWPDVDRFLPDEILNPVKNLPVPVTDLEAALAKAENT